MTQARYLYSELVSAIEARRNCDKATPRNAEWFDKWTHHIYSLATELPHGSGIDNGCSVDLEASHADKLVIHTAFHHMNENGMYDGWTDHTVTVTPSFRGIHIRISGRDRNQIKDYLTDLFDDALTNEVEPIKA